MSEDETLLETEEDNDHEDDISDLDDDDSLGDGEDDEDVDIPETTKESELEAAQKAKIARRRIEQLREEKELRDQLTDYHLQDDD